MSKVFNMVGGGGGKNISSIIITGLLSTDTVTCTKDGKSYPAAWDEVDLQWEIVRLPLGTFTVIATNGTKTTTETVLIDNVGVYVVEISFRYWLYRKGNEYEYRTGGWTTNGYYRPNYSTISAGVKEDDCLKLTNCVSGMMMFGTNNAVDVSSYSKLCIEYESTGVSQWNPSVEMVGNKGNYNNTVILANYGTDYFVSNERKVFEADIPQGTKSAYIVWLISAVDSNIHKAYNIWLE